MEKLFQWTGWCLPCVPKRNSGRAPSASVQPQLSTGIHSEASPKRNGLNTLIEKKTTLLLVPHWPAFLAFSIWRRHLSKGVGLLQPVGTAADVRMHGAGPPRGLGSPASSPSEGHIVVEYHVPNKFCLVFLEMYAAQRAVLFCPGKGLLRVYWITLSLCTCCPMQQWWPDGKSPTETMSRCWWKSIFFN